VVTCKIKH